MLRNYTRYKRYEIQFTQNTKVTLHKQFKVEDV